VTGLQSCCSAQSSSSVNGDSPGMTNSSRHTVH